MLPAVPPSTPPPSPRSVGAVAVTRPVASAGAAIPDSIAAPLWNVCWGLFVIPSGLCSTPGTFPGISVWVGVVYHFSARCNKLGVLALADCVRGKSEYCGYFARIAFSSETSSISSYAPGYFARIICASVCWSCGMGPQRMLSGSDLADPPIEPESFFLCGVIDRTVLLGSGRADELVAGVI